MGGIGGRVEDDAGTIAGGLGAAGAAVAASGIGAPLGAVLEAGAGLAGTISLGGKAAGLIGDGLGKK